MAQAQASQTLSLPPTLALPKNNTNTKRYYERMLSTSIFKQVGPSDCSDQSASHYQGVIRATELQLRF